MVRVCVHPLVVPDLFALDWEGAFDQLALLRGASYWSARQ
jgi:hypothetical protein